MLGTGLIALDLVFEDAKGRAPSSWAGGTCGNVLAILSYFGWRALPVARLNGDEASQRIESDLGACGVDLRFAHLRPTAPAPVIVQRIHRTPAGQVSHRFSPCCPRCGAWFPSFRPVPLKPLDVVELESTSTSVFFADRAFPGSLRLARTAKARGALIVFEPSGIGQPRHFEEMVGLADVLKYSRERLPSLGGPAVPKGVRLEIQTLGASGVRFRAALPRYDSGGWVHMDAFDVPDLRDAAGSGDWCTAGVLHTLGRGGRTAFLRTSRPQLHQALRFGQALASWNCRFVGARGGMYVTSAQDCLEGARAISSGKHAPSARSVRLDKATSAVLSKICSHCAP
ncbi:MAG: carbohydrate kinase [Acidobacteria bacterium]|nr:carbohydrate kinase [Acidobacteriota bacterium]